MGRYFSQQTVTYYQRVKYGIQGLTNVEYVSTNKTGLGGLIKNDVDCNITNSGKTIMNRVSTNQFVAINWDVIFLLVKPL